MINSNTMMNDSLISKLNFACFKYLLAPKSPILERKKKKKVELNRSGDDDDDDDD